MKISDFVAQLRSRTRTNSTTLTDTEIKRILNIYKDELVQIVSTRVSEHYFGFIETTNLVADQREYALPYDSATGDSIISLSRIEANLKESASADDNWVSLDEVPMESVESPITEQHIVSRYGNSKGFAKFYLYRNSIFLLTGTIINVTAGLKIHCDGYPSDITDLTSTDDLSVSTSLSRGLPKELHLPLLLLCSQDVKSNLEKPRPLDEMERSIDKRIAFAIEILKKRNTDREFHFLLPEDKGIDEFGFDNGYNL